MCIRDSPSLGTPIRFNTDTYAAANNGTQTLDTTGTVHSDTPEAGGINAVSYTHLDVYKRQAL